MQPVQNVIKASNSTKIHCGATTIKVTLQSGVMSIKFGNENKKSEKNNNCMLALLRFVINLIIFLSFASPISCAKAA